MPLSIKFPEAPSVPSEITLFATPYPSWPLDAVADLARRMEIDGEVVDRGMWFVVDDDRAALEVYCSSHSFRYGRLDGDGERQTPGTQLPQDDARSIADRWVEEFGPRDSRFEVDSITEAELLVSRSEETEPERYVTATQINYRFTLDGLPLLGPGAKMQVEVDPAGEVMAAYRFWREPRPMDTVRVMPPEEVFDRFARGPMFTHLDDDTARAEVTEVRLGYLAPPPTETSSLLVPAYELHGVLSTEVHPRYEFVAHLPAAPIDSVVPKRAA